MIDLNDLFNKVKYYYNIHPESYSYISKGCYKLSDKTGEYILKLCNSNLKNKYNFLKNMGVDNILYPIANKDGNFISSLNEDFESSFLISNYYKNSYMIDEIKAKDLINELKSLHRKTSFKKTLEKSKSKPKMEEMFNHLNYKFSEIESFIRSLECREYDEFSIPILKNYHYILDAKKQMININRKIVSAIKESKTVDYCFLHNNPKKEHLIILDGNKYLISIDNSILGICSFDVAKFYIENEDVNINMKAIIDDYFSDYDDEFYYNYFVFLVLLFYIESLNINDKDYVSSQSFVYSSNCIKKFLQTFTFKN